MTTRTMLVHYADGERIAEDRPDKVVYSCSTGHGAVRFQVREGPQKYYVVMVVGGVQQIVVPRYRIQWNATRVINEVKQIMRGYQNGTA